MDKFINQGHKSPKWTELKLSNPPPSNWFPKLPFWELGYSKDMDHPAKLKTSKTFP
jgi:hypothetical protein